MWLNRFSMVPVCCYHVTGIWLACFMDHNLIAYLTISYLSSEAKLPLALSPNHVVSTLWERVGNVNKTNFRMPCATCWHFYALNWNFLSSSYRKFSIIIGNLFVIFISMDSGGRRVVILAIKILLHVQGWFMMVMPFSRSRSFRYSSTMVNLENRADIQSYFTT